MRNPRQHKDKPNDSDTQRAMIMQIMIAIRLNEIPPSTPQTYGFLLFPTIPEHSHSINRKAKNEKNNPMETRVRMYCSLFSSKSLVAANPVRGGSAPNMGIAVCAGVACDWYTGGGDAYPVIVP